MLVVCAHSGGPEGARSGAARRSRLATFGAAVLLLTTVIGVPAASAADDLSGLRGKKADVEAKKAKAAASVNALKASSADVSRSIDALQSNVGAQRNALQSASAASIAAREAADQAAAEEQRASVAFDAAKASIKESAIRAYASGGSQHTAAFAAGKDPAAIARARAYTQVATGQQADALDRLSAASKDLGRARAAQAKASKNADARLLASQKRLGDLNAALATQTGFENSVQARLDQQLSEAAALEGTDKDLAARITAAENEIAKKLASRPAPSGGGGGGPISVVGDGEIVSVRGIQVHRSIANNVAGLLAAADGAGLNMSGGGYRSAQGQIDTRKRNCGSSNYDVYQKPASQCSPPTARPGSSMHEKGLAIDFTCNGQTIPSHSSPCFGFLSKNAGRFGLYNLPSEPWHWSTNGN